MPKTPGRKSGGISANLWPCGSTPAQPRGYLSENPNQAGFTFGPGWLTRSALNFGGKQSGLCKQQGTRRSRQVRYRPPS